MLESVEMIFYFIKIIDFISVIKIIYCNKLNIFFPKRGRRGRDRMAVGFTTICAIGVYHKSCEFKSGSWRGQLNTTICDKICQ
jgi:hypothetical protein